MSRARSPPDASLKLPAGNDTPRQSADKDPAAISPVISLRDAEERVVATARKYFADIGEGPAEPVPKAQFLGGILRRLGVEFYRLLDEDPFARLPDADLQCWGSCIVLRRWKREFFDYVRPLLFAPGKSPFLTQNERNEQLVRLPPDQRAVALEKLDRAEGEAIAAAIFGYPPGGSNPVPSMVEAALEVKTFRIREILGPVLRPGERSSFVVRVIDYGFEGMKPRPIPPLFPQFVDDRGKSWNLPRETGRTIADDIAGWALAQSALGLLSDRRVPHRYREGTRVPLAVQMRILDLHNKMRFGPKRIHSRLTDEGFDPIPSVQTIRRILNR
jgi:hypothetical protein